MPAGRWGLRRSSREGERGKSALGLIKRQRHKPRTANRRFREVLSILKSDPPLQSTTEQELARPALESQPPKSGGFF